MPRFFKVLSPLSSVGTLEFYLVEQEVGGAHFSQPHGTGTEEFVTVLEGRIEVRAGRPQKGGVVDLLETRKTLLGENAERR